MTDGTILMPHTGMQRPRLRKRTAISETHPRRILRNSAPVGSCILLVSLLMHVCGSVEGFSSYDFATTRRSLVSESRGTNKKISECIIFYKHHATAITTRHASTKTDSENHKKATHVSLKKKKPKSKAPKGPKTQQTSYVNDLVSSMGLTPVPKPKANKIKQQNTKARYKEQSPSLSAQLDYARNGHAVLRNYVDPVKLVPIREELLRYGTKHQLKAWRQKVEVAAGLEASKRCHSLEDCKRELEQIGVASDRLPFLQYFNTWRTLPCVYDMALDLAETAAILLDVPSVRLYQDSLFMKRSVDGPTPWHTDARMAPFDTSSLVTLWIPLQDIARHGSALQFVSKSHADFALPFWNPFPSASSSDNGKETNPWDHLDARYQQNEIINYMPLSKGDLTAHSGWTLHCADSQPTYGKEGANPSAAAGADRLALAISYVDARAPVRENVLTDGDHGDDEDQWSYADWVKEVSPGQEFEHPLVPIVWP